MMLTANEKAALAMHELMKREQTLLRERIDEQHRISTLSDDELKRLVMGIDLRSVDHEADTTARLGRNSSPSKDIHTHE